VLVHGPGAAAWNMAVDETLLRDADRCTLRIYRWRRPTVSLGYNQRWERALDADLAADRSLAVVRRPTGGRAVLHADEVTYCFTGPADHPRLGGGVIGAYRALAVGLAAGLRRLGVSVELERSRGRLRRGARSRERAMDADPACFAVRSRYELVAHGRKLAGSAQRRRDGRVLQHGSLLLGAPVPRLWEVLGPGSDEAVAASVGLTELLGRRPGLRRLAGFLAREVAASLGLAVRMGALTVVERRHARARARRYASVAWTRRR